MQGENCEVQALRLRLFESEWLDGLVKPPGSSKIGGVGAHMLNAVLLGECRHWFERGKEVGYFDSAASLDIPETDLIDEAQFFARAFLSARGEADFAIDLIEARAELTPERLKFLRLTFFADQEEWEREFGLVQALAASIQEAPWQVVPENYMGAVSWALSGADGNLNLMGSPASWRSRSPNDSNLVFQYTDPLNDRWKALESARARIMRAVVEFDEARAYEVDTVARGIVHRRPIPPAEQ